MTILLVPAVGQLIGDAQVAWLLLRSDAGLVVEPAGQGGGIELGPGPHHHRHHYLVAGIDVGHAVDRATTTSGWSATASAMGPAGKFSPSTRIQSLVRPAK